MATEWEVVVISEGPAGLSTSLAAAESGAKVTLLDACRVSSGQLNKQPPKH
jgi:thioredoxin reductase